ncbi:MAG: hypothetical protein K6T87_23070 [Roseiflexus sp.]|uniref:hypothetical protein n=1 Tax=Roseiflexus sp. TaxID=2562120 RepID=UPI0025F3E36D|nr:hypothetical protein [Roseiflexus sp.]MCL6543437.1 hypothetical protein [Roseiflexus sp.]
MDVNADPPPERAAMVRAGRVERGIALARCCGLTGVVASPAWFSSATRPRAHGCTMRQP